MKDTTSESSNYYKIDGNYLKLLKCQLIARDFLLQKYFNKIRILIIEIIVRDQKEYIHEPTLFGDNSIYNIRSLEISFKQRQKQMKEGVIAQLIIGNYIGWEDLGIGHPSGLDCRKKDNSIIMDVKNKWNTCNSGSQEALLNKLAKYKKENPDTRCIWAIVNPKPFCKVLCEKIIHNGYEIEKIQGNELLKLVFTNNKDRDYHARIVHFVKETLYGNTISG